MTEAHAFLHVCISCRAGQQLSQEPAETSAGETAVPGTILYRRLESLLSGQPGHPVRLLEAKCLSNCDQGCSAAIATPGKWSYLLGGLDLGQASDLLDYAAIYAVSRTGVVMPSKRPASLAAMVRGRIPPLPMEPS